MLERRYDYALEKFTEAVGALATAPGDVRERLLGVFQGPLAVITPEHLPDDLQEDYRWIQQQVTRYDEYPEKQEWFKDHPHLLSTAVEATMARIRNSTGSNIARRIYKILDELQGRR